jgi:hypothetical protein
LDDLHFIDYEMDEKDGDYDQNALGLIRIFQVYHFRGEFAHPGCD